MGFYLQKYKSPIGLLYIVEKEQKLCVIVFESMWTDIAEKFPELKEKKTLLLQKTQNQLQEYFQGKRKNFQLPFILEGTDFQKRVWRSLLKIPFGKTKTYKEQAMSIDAPKSARAVGRVNGLNSLCIILPCHRVIGSNGSLTGYAGGLEVKKFLLDLERMQ